MQCLFSIGLGLQPRVFYASANPPTHSLFSGCHFVDFIYDQMYLSTTSTKFIAGQVNILHLEHGRNFLNHLIYPGYSSPVVCVWRGLNLCRDAVGVFSSSPFTSDKALIRVSAMVHKHKTVPFISQEYLSESEIISQQEFELPCYHSAVNRFNHFTTSPAHWSSG